jgi:hypothetical protein
MKRIPSLLGAVALAGLLLLGPPVEPAAADPPPACQQDEPDHCPPRAPHTCRLLLQWGFPQTIPAFLICVLDGGGVIIS